MERREYQVPRLKVLNEALEPLLAGASLNTVDGEDGPGLGSGDADGDEGLAKGVWE